MKRKNNNHYLIMKRNGEWFDFSSDGGEYFIYLCKEEHFNEIKPEEYIYYRVKDVDMYIVIEPLSDGITKKNHQIRLLRNLPKIWRGVVTKWDMEKVINDLKK